jgi:hypothetical protein
VSLIPVLGTLWYIVDIGFRPGSNGRNRFGPNPRDLSNDDTSALAVPAVSSFLDAFLIMPPIIMYLALLYGMASLGSYDSDKRHKKSSFNTPSSEVVGMIDAMRNESQRQKSDV